MALRRDTRLQMLADYKPENEIECEDNTAAKLDLGPVFVDLSFQTREDLIKLLTNFAVEGLCLLWV